MKSSTCIALVFLTLSCTKRQLSSGISVDKEFEPYVQLFVQEAENRGYLADFSDTGLVMEFGTTPSGASAVCHAFGNAHDGSHHITFNRERWDRRTNDDKASRVFHELGHCELSRPHNNAFLENDMWKTMMRGSPIPNDKSHVLTAFYGFRKAYYIDELFDPSTVEPSWARMNFDFSEGQGLETEELVSIQSITDTIFELTEEVEDFEIEASMAINEPQENVFFQWGSKENGTFMSILGERSLVRIGIIEDSKDYVLHQEFHGEIDFSKSNKFTIRENEDFCAIFINEDLEFFLDTLNTDLASIGFDSDGAADISSISLKKIYN